MLAALGFGGGEKEARLQCVEVDQQNSVAGEDNIFFHDAKFSVLHGLIDKFQCFGIQQCETVLMILFIQICYIHQVD
jgi:hypothetical protein